MFLRTDREGWNAWHKASFRGNVEVIREIWEFAKEIQTTEEIKKFNVINYRP